MPENKQPIKKNIIPRFMVGTGTKVLCIYLVNPQREIEWVGDVPQYKDVKQMPFKLDVPIFFKGSKPDDEIKEKIFSDVVIRIKNYNEKETKNQQTILDFDEEELRNNYETEFTRAFPTKEKVKVNILPRFSVGYTARQLKLWCVDPERETKWEWRGAGDAPKYIDTGEFEATPPLVVKTFIPFKNPDRSAILADAMKCIEIFNQTNKSEIEYDSELFIKNFDEAYALFLEKSDETKISEDELKMRKEMKKLEADDEKITTEKINEIADELMEKYHVHTVRGRMGISGEEVWAWNGINYNKGGDVDIRHDVKILLEDKYKKSYADAVINSIKASTDIFREQMPSRPHCVNLLNGVLEYNNQGNINFIERTPDSDFHDYNFLYVMPIKYDPNAKCPEIDKVVQAILVDNTKEESEENGIVVDEAGNEVPDIWDDGYAAQQYLEHLEATGDEALLEEINRDIYQKVNGFYDFLGSILMTDYSIKMALVLLGAGDTGKSTLLNIAEQFVGTGITGTKNFCSVSLKDIDSSNGNRFAAAGLDGKLANIVDELPKVDVNNVDTFKNLVGGKGTEVENKGTDRFFIENRAKMLFAANETPRVDPLVSEVMFKRIFPMECLNVFRRGEANLDIVNRKFSDEELSGLLNHAINGLKRLLKNRRYIFDESETASIWNKYLGSTNVLSDFVKTCLEVTGNPKDFVFKTDMYQAYLEFHESKHDGTQELNKNQFGGHLVNYNPYRLKDDKVKNPLKSQAAGKIIKDRAWTGCKLLAVPRPSAETSTKKNGKTTLKEAVIKMIELPENVNAHYNILRGNPTTENIESIVKCSTAFKKRISDEYSEEAVRKIVSDYCAAIRAKAQV